ncbi:MAG TPA: ABC transporter permease [Euzebya sp.]|nr:ABC transporter permease [Euzebya sp.]
MVVKEFRQLRRDRRTVALMVAMPLLLLVVFGYAASFDVDHVTAIVVGEDAERIASQLPEFFAVEGVDASAGRQQAFEDLQAGVADAAFVTGSDPEVLLDGSLLFSARAAVSVLAQAPQLPPPTVLFNPGLDTSAVMVPSIAGLILVFIGTLITSLGVVRERQTGTLEQLAVMPLRPRDVFVGKIAPYFLVAAVDMVVVLSVGAWLFDVPFAGSVGLFAVGAVLFLFVTLGLGVLISTVSENQGQAVQMAMMTLLPQVLLSGMIFPLESMAASVRWIAYVLPLTYFIDIARSIMVRGAGLDAVVFPMAMLGVLGLAVFSLAIVRFRRDLAPSPRSSHRRRAAQSHPVGA